MIESYSHEPAIEQLNASHKIQLYVTFFGNTLQIINLCIVRLYRIIISYAYVFYFEKLFYLKQIWANSPHEMSSLSVQSCLTGLPLLNGPY